MLVQDHGELVVHLTHPPHRVRQQERPAGERARDVVRVITQDGVGGVAVLADQLDRFGGGGSLADEDGVHARHHHLTEGPLGELQGVVDQVGGVLGQLALLVGLTDPMAELLQSGAVVQLLDGLDTDLAQQPVRRAVEDPYEGTDDLQVAEGGGGKSLREPRRHGDREVLWRQLASTICTTVASTKARMTEMLETATSGMPMPVGFEQRGHGRLGDETDDQAGHGDAQLGAGQHERQPLQHLQSTGRPPVARLGLTGKGEPVGGDVRELLGHAGHAELEGTGEPGEQAARDGAALLGHTLWLGDSRHHPATTPATTVDKPVTGHFGHRTPALDGAAHPSHQHRHKSRETKGWPHPSSARDWH